MPAQTNNRNFKKKKYVPTVKVAFCKKWTQSFETLNSTFHEK